MYLLVLVFGWTLGVGCHRLWGNSVDRIRADFYEEATKDWEELYEKRMELYEGLKDQVEILENIENQVRKNK